MTGYTNQWVMLTVVVDYTGKTAEVYRNGTKVGSTHTLSGTPVYPTTSRAKYIGEYSSSHSFDWHEWMHNVMVWDGTSNMTAGDISTLYNDLQYTHIDTNSTSLSATPTLTSGTRYEFFVHGSNGGGAGIDSVVASHSTLVTTPGAPSVAATAVGQLTVTFPTITLNPDRQLWNLEWSANGTSGWVAVTGSPFAKGTTEFVDSGIGNGTLRYYRINAENTDLNESAWSANGSATTWYIGDPPLNVDVDDVT